MTAPNVTIKWCQKKARCRWCEQFVELGTPMVKVFFWNKGEDGNRKWNISHYYHFPECYAKQGLDYLNRNPYVPHARGRKTKLPEADRRKRFLLVRKFNELVQRRNNIKLPYPDSLAMEAQLTKRMVDTMLEITTVGGVPKSWVKKVITS